MKRVLAFGLGGLLVLVAALYVADYAWLRLRLARNQSAAFDTVSVDVVYEVPQKGNKAEYLPQGVQNQTCVRSLFPHLGDQPCWYLRRHTEQQVNF